MSWFFEVSFLVMVVGSVLIAGESCFDRDSDFDIACADRCSFEAHGRLPTADRHECWCLTTERIAVRQEGM